MMKTLKYLLLLAGLFLFTVESGNAQDVSAQILSLENDLRDFNYQRVLNKGRFLLLESEITQKDSLKIFEYILNAAFSLNDTITAKKTVEDALRSSPGFAPDPRITSPKIIDFFNSIKLRFMKDEPQNAFKATEQISGTFKPVPTKYLLASLLYPGSSHLFRGNKRGYYFTGISSILLSGIVFSSIKAADARENYMQARTNVNFDQLYDKYNSTYKIRNGLVLTYLAFNLYTLYDFYSAEIKNNELLVNLTQTQDSVIIRFSYCW